ncbi:group II truncated hemoglobin [Dictyobacter aurantiacus]|uniref:Globin n=1 Tax=Dictyobacter aurantiacus TaxID=1936993 RepID=A0A401ZJH7_9CHLR|nr:group II truncated hemoglobin [Dictyobacter aurantiacus]GCE06992.1 globin [Dictyobacter aurantiacus]
MPVPTLYEWAGGMPALERLTTVFYQRVMEDSLLQPIFASMPKDHPQHVAWWLAEVFGGPAAYSGPYGGSHHSMMSKHLGRHLTEEQRVRWAHMLGAAADEAGLPTDPEFRSAFVAYIEWGTRIAVIMSQPGMELPAKPEPMPHWGWGEVLPPEYASTKTES